MACRDLGVFIDVSQFLTRTGAASAGEVSHALPSTSVHDPHDSQSIEERLGGTIE
jgi:hypothetical protein